MSALTDAALAEAAAARIMDAAAHGDGKSRWLVDADAVRDLAYLTPKLITELRTARQTNAAASENRRDAWAALAMIREAIETLGPVGVLPSEETVSTRPEHGHFLDEGAALVEGIRRIAQERDAARAALEEMRKSRDRYAQCALDAHICMTLNRPLPPPATSAPEVG